MSEVSEQSGKTDASGFLLKDFDPRGYDLLEDALIDAQWFDHREGGSSIPEVTLDAPEGTVFGYPIGAGGEVAVFYADEDEILGADRAMPVVDKVALGLRFVSDGWHRGLYGEPIVLLELADEHGKALQPPDYVAVGIGSAGLCNVVVYSVDHKFDDRLDPYDYITRDNEQTAA